MLFMRQVVVGANDESGCRFSECVMVGVAD